MKAIGYLAVSVLVIGLSAVWSGFVLSILWSWFIAGTFGLPQLTINAAIGLYLVAGYLGQNLPDKTERTPEESLVYACSLGLFRPAVALGFGGVVHLFA